MKGSDAPRVVVVGGGSAGMMAAVAAARAGARVTVLERMARVGRKLLATGNGRCNLTNLGAAVPRYHGRDPGFAAGALRSFTVADTLDFFAGLGIHPAEEEGGKVFPRSGQASAVLDVLRLEMERLGVEVQVETPVRGLERSPGGFTVAAGGGRSWRAASVVLASGGRAAPQLGSNGSGYALAVGLGHRLVEPLPALTRVRLSSPHLRRLAGVKVEGRITLAAGGRPLAAESGEILFTPLGVSGPPVLQVSRVAAERAARGMASAALLDLVPELGEEELRRVLERRFTSLGSRPLAGGLTGFLHKRLEPVVMREAGVPAAGRGCGTVEGEEVRRLAALLKGWSLPVTGVESWPEAQVTAGGIDTADIDPGTMESRTAPGLFLAGEIVDIDGDCGGFNLQWAWSSGHVAGEAAARRAAGSRD